MPEITDSQAVALEILSLHKACIESESELSQALDAEIEALRVSNKAAMQEKVAAYVAAGGDADALHPWLHGILK